MDAGFGLPNRRKRVFVLASLHGDARDVLLSQVGTGWGHSQLHDGCSCTLLLLCQPPLLAPCCPLLHRAAVCSVLSPRHPLFASAEESIAALDSNTRRPQLPCSSMCQAKPLPLMPQRVRDDGDCCILGGRLKLLLAESA